jgi:predicted metal-dependent enzyme (double-stranded beta helix superfamily)
MTTAYTLERFIEYLAAITSRDEDPEVITRTAAPLLERLCRNPEAIPAEYRTAPPGQRGRYMLHRAPRFNITSVIWRPGDEAASHDHETWGLVGVVENEIQETRYVSSGKRALGGTVALDVREVLRHKPGAVSRLVPPHDEIHAMYNPTAKNTIEIHVYGKDLMGLQRHVFDADGTVKSLVSQKYMNC